MLFTGLFKDYIKRIRKGYIGRRVIEMRVEGMRARGRPRQSWMEIVKEDLKEKKLDSDECLNRMKWRYLVRKVDLAYEQ